MLPLVVHPLGDDKVVMLFPAPLVNYFVIVYIYLEEPVSLLVHFAFRKDPIVSRL